MYLNTLFELTVVLDSDKFQKVLNRAYANIKGLDDDEYVDDSFVSKGMKVTFRDSQYKKKVRLLVSTNALLGNDKPEPDRLAKKIEKRINDYFNYKYSLKDFTLTGMTLSTDIDVQGRVKAADYIKVIQRIGKVKGFSPPGERCNDNNISFSLDGNSNGIEFVICDLQGFLKEQLKEAESDRKQLKGIINKSDGLLRAEVRLTKPKTIRAYTNETDTAGQIADLSVKSEKIFLDTFLRIIPFGNFYKKDKAVEIIRKEVSDMRMRRRMLRLVALIPEKKSLLLAQKALNYRRVDDVMDMFGQIELAPVTISKRHGVERLDNLYKYM